MEPVFYRAWDSLEKRMYEVTALWWSAAVPGQIDRMELVGTEQPFPTKIVSRTSNMGHFILMQGTGLRDKNKQMVYACDIVQSDQSDHGWVVYDQTQGAWRIQSYAWWCYLSEPAHIEILGNVHVNTDLLKSPTRMQTPGRIRIWT